MHLCESILQRLFSWGRSFAQLEEIALRGQLGTHDLSERLQRNMPLLRLLIWQQRKQLARRHQEMSRRSAQRLKVFAKTRRLVRRTIRLVHYRDPL